MRNRILSLVAFIQMLLVFTSCHELTYGEKLTINPKSEVYYKNGASTEEAKNLGGFLLRNNYFDTTSDKSVQLSHNADTFVVKFIVKEDKIKGNDEAELAFRYMSVLLRDSVFSGKPTKLILTDEKFNDLRTIKELSQQEIQGFIESTNGDSSYIETPLTDSIR